MNDDFVVIDFETACPSHDSPCSLGLVVVKQLEIVSAHHYFINPNIDKWSVINSRIHHICPDMVVNSPEFNSLWPDVRSFFDNSLIVAHNISFDCSVLHKTLDRYGLPRPFFRNACTLELSRILFPSLKNHCLDTVCKLMNINLDNHHEALSDATACARLKIAFEKNDHRRITLADIEEVNKTIKSKAKVFFKKNEQLSGSVLKPDFDIIEKDNPFFMKKVVFTGVLSGYTRNSAANLLKALGADIDTSISSKTDFVILGSQPGPSKLKRIEQFNYEGSSIKILEEQLFNEVLKKFL